MKVFIFNIEYKTKIGLDEQYSRNLTREERATTPEFDQRRIYILISN